MNQQSLPPVKARFSINIVENSQSQLLFLKRSSVSKFGPGRWGFPAGHIEPGETAAECALRELKEEIGPVFTIELSGSMGPIRDSYYGGVYEIYLYHQRWLDGEVTLNHEHTHYAWVGREEYKHYPVMDGIDEDIRYFGIWPLEYLNEDKLPVSGQ